MTHSISNVGRCLDPLAYNVPTYPQPSPSDRLSLLRTLRTLLAGRFTNPTQFNYVGWRFLPQQKPTHLNTNNFTNYNIISNIIYPPCARIKRRYVPNAQRIRHFSLCSLAKKRALRLVGIKNSWKYEKDFSNHTNIKYDNKLKNN